MAVGEHETVRRDDDAGTRAAVGVDLDDRGTDGVDGIDDRARVSIEQIIVVLEPVSL
jgi:hypothetical protein